MAHLLIESDDHFTDAVEMIVGKRPWASRSEEIMAEESQPQLPAKEEPKALPETPAKEGSEPQSGTPGK